MFVATERAKKLARVGRQCATLIFDVAAHHDAFSQSTMKAISTLPMTGPSLPLTKAVHRSLQSFAMQMQGLAICLRGSVARPLHASLQSMGETAPSIFNRYSSSRQMCATARQAALKTKQKYTNAVRDTEFAIQSFKDAMNEDEAQCDDDALNRTTDSEAQSARTPYEKGILKFGRKHGLQGNADNLIQLLNDVQFLEAQYALLVKEENKSVLQAGTLEMMGLESIQHLEQERVNFFTESISRSVQAEKGAFDKIVLSSLPEVTDGLDCSKATTGLDEKKKPDFFMNLLNPAMTQPEDDVGIMEADSLGLPEDIGRLHGDVRAAIRAAESRGHVVKAIASSLEDMAIASTSLSMGLTSRLGQDGYGKKRVGIHDPLSLNLETSEGVRALAYWISLMGTIENFAEATKILAENLRCTRHEKFDTHLLSADKDIKRASDTNEVRWKHLCEAARTENRTQNRYQQAQSQFEKARDRMKSVDSSEDALNQHGTRQRLNSNGGKNGTKMSKALGNMMAILPNGGERAMQMLGEDTRQAIAKSTYDEATQRQSKDKDALEGAIAAKTKSMLQYTSTAECLIETFKKADTAGWSDIHVALESIIVCCNTFRKSRVDDLESLVSQAPHENDDIHDMIDWTTKAMDHLARKAAEFEKSSFENHGFCLQVERVPSKQVYKLLNFVGLEDELDLVTETEEPQGDREVDRSNEIEDIVLPLRAMTTAAGPTQLISKCTTVVDPVLPEDLFKDGPDAKCLPTPDRGMSKSTKEFKSLAEVLLEKIDGNDVQGVEKASSTFLSGVSGVGGLAPDTNKADTEIFLAHFWTDRSPDETPPTVIESFSAAYWPKDDEGYISPLLHGRIFLTANQLYFVGWGDKKIVLDWKDVLSVKKATNLMGGIDNSLSVAYMKDSEESCLFFGSFTSREEAFQLMERLSTVARAIFALQESSSANCRSERESIPAKPVPADQTLKKMSVVFSQTIKNISIKKFYDVAWSEGVRTNASPLYGPWLKKAGSMNVQVDDWTFSEDGSSPIEGGWCRERYNQKRQVHFQFKRKTHLYIGPPVAKVNQTQYCRLEGNDKCIVAFTVEMEGIPYADCFAVEVRWVAHREGMNDVKVEIGVFVDFRKATIFASKIKQGTLTETTPIHASLFAVIKAECANENGESGEIDTGGDDDGDIAEVVKYEITTDDKGGIRLLGVSLDSIRQGVQSLVKGAVAGDTTVLVVACIFIVCLLGLFGIAKRAWSPLKISPSVGVSIEHLSMKIDNLQEEMKQLHDTMKSLVLALESARRNIE